MVRKLDAPFVQVTADPLPVFVVRQLPFAVSIAMVDRLLTLKDIRPEALKSVEGWVIKADRNNKKRFFKFFSQGPEGASRGSGATSAAAGQVKPLSMTVLEEAEKELELRNWNTTYSITNNMLGDTIAAVKKRAQGDKSRLLDPFIRELFNPNVKDRIKDMTTAMSPAEMDDFLRLLRSLSIAYEQDRDLYSSEYIIEYTPKRVQSVTAAAIDPFAASLSAPITYAPPKIHRFPAVTKKDRAMTPAPSKPVKAPPGQKNMLQWAGSSGVATSAYRAHFQKPAEAFGHVIPTNWSVSMACGRTVPDHLIDPQHRANLIMMPYERESRHRLRQTRPTAQPSWHLLFKDGVTTTQGETGPHDPGDRTIYMKDFTSETSVVKQSKPTLDPFGSSITIGMSEYPYHSTTYQDEICRSAEMEYDRRLV